MLGVTTRIRLKLKRVHSGRLSVTAVAVRDLNHLFEEFQRREGESDYLVGWLDGFAKGRKLGRGVIHAANYLGEGEDPKGAKTLTDQALPRRFWGLPRHWMWRLLRPWVNNFGMRWVNRLKYVLSRLFDGRRGRTFWQSHVAFSFLLDYIPRWRDAYGPQGFIQVQPFIPTVDAKVAFREILDRCHGAKIWPYLVVVKRHVPDDYLMSHALDGYSLAMDFRITDKNRQRVWRLGQEIGDLTVAHGGRIYFAKDCVARPDQILTCYGEERLRRFEELRVRLDPHGTLSSQLSRRVLPESIFRAP
jgi:FAD/FMN-containing dehydrogenase